MTDKQSNMKWLGIIVVLLVVSLGILLLLYMKSPTPPLTITVGTFTKAIAHAPLYAVLHNGWFQEDPSLKNVKVNYKVYNDRPSALLLL